MDMNQIAVEIAYSDGYEAGKQAAAEQIFADIDSKLRLNKGTHVGRSIYYAELASDIENLKIKYGVK